MAINTKAPRLRRRRSDKSRGRCPVRGNDQRVAWCGCNCAPCDNLLEMVMTRKPWLRITLQLGKEQPSYSVDNVKYKLLMLINIIVFFLCLAVILLGRGNKITFLFFSYQINFDSDSNSTSVITLKNTQADFFKLLMIICYIYNVFSP